MTDTSIRPVRRATWEDADLVAGIIAQTFHDLRASQYLIPDPELRAKVYPAFFKLVYVNPAMSGGGVVYVTEALDAAAVWLHINHDEEPDPDAEAALDTQLRETLDDELYQRMIVEFGGALDAVHPHDRGDHDFLGVLGSARRGGGRSLLAEHHRQLDEQGRAAYLEAADPSLVPYYSGHGYAPTGEVIRLPNGAEMPTMWRDPR